MHQSQFYVFSFNFHKCIALLGYILSQYECTTAITGRKNSLLAYTASSQKAGIISSCSCVASAMHRYSLFIKCNPMSLHFTAEFKTRTSECYNTSFVSKINILCAFPTLRKKSWLAAFKRNSSTIFSL